MSIIQVITTWDPQNFMDTHWIDKENGNNLFYIYVIEQKEDYLISDN
jgi:hypothetical protein